MELIQRIEGTWRRKEVLVLENIKIYDSEIKLAKERQKLGFIFDRSGLTPYELIIRSMETLLKQEHLKLSQVKIDSAEWEK